VRGHEQLAQAFAAVVRRGRLAHAYLFVGPEGVGKKLFAVALAKALLCEAPGAAERIAGCDRCPACLQVEAGTHPDYQLTGLPADKHEFPVALMQELTRNLARKPARGRHRVAILDDADHLNEEAANAFLKTLEEPPPRSLLILLGTSADRQLPTILSRCQVIRFAPLPVEVVADELVREGIVEQPAEARRLARLSGGSLGEARALADPGLWQFRADFLDRLSQPKPDAVALGELLVRFAEEEGKDSAVKRQRAGLALRFLIEFLRAAVLLPQGQEPALAEPRDLQAARRLAERISPDRLLDVLERCVEADFQIDRRVQLVLVLEALADAIAPKLQAGPR
jgi:DNA polymerase-3 subunit delta'